MKGDKYRNLQKWLENNSSERITLTFEKIEEILGFTLPESAKTYTAWQANDSSHSQTVWLKAGYKTMDFSNAASERQITFEKVLYSPKKKDKQCENNVNYIRKDVSKTTNRLGKTLNDCLENEIGGERKMLSFEELKQKIESLPAGTVIPKPESENDFTVKVVGMRRGEEALVYRIPTNNPIKYPRGHEKGVTFTEFYKAYTVLQETSKLTREWFDKNLYECAGEGGCNFTTIGGIFELLGIASYSESATYTRA